jgi:Sec-independent protein translocase protein TatA
MNLSFSQLVFIIFIGFLLFGNLPLKLQDLSKFLQEILLKLNTQKKEIETKDKKAEEKRDDSATQKFSKSDEKKE